MTITCWFTCWFQVCYEIWNCNKNFYDGPLLRFQSREYSAARNIDFSSLKIHRKNNHLRGQNNLAWSIFLFNQIWSKIFWILITLHLNDNEKLTVHSDWNSWAFTKLSEINIHRSPLQRVDARRWWFIIYSTGEKSGSPQWLCKQCITYRRRAQATIFNYVDVDLFRGKVLRSMLRSMMEARVSICAGRTFTSRAYNSRRIHDKRCSSQFIKCGRAWDTTA